MSECENEDGRGIQSSGDAEPAVAPVGECCALAPVGRGLRRKDAGRLHAMRHAVLSRYPLEALRHLGEDLKALRRTERRFRTELKPKGAIADMIFDRFFSSYLRCVLAARTEANVFARQDESSSKRKTEPRLVDGGLPTLVIERSAEHGSLHEALEAETLRELSLVQRYDRHFGREMFSALALLLVLRRSGEAGLEDAMVNAFGVGSK
jgi:hypothetical protein